MNLLYTLLPYSLLLYFLIRSVKNSIYLLGIPFMMFFRQCLFFDNVKVLRIPKTLGPDIILLGWLLIVWAVISSRGGILIGSRRTDYYEHKRTNWLNIIVIGLMIISAGDLFMVLSQYINLKEVYTEFFTLVSLFVGYFVIKDFVRYVNPIDLKEFLFSIVIVNTIASFLYLVHQGLHIPIYDVYDEFSVEEFQGVLISRTFWFMPILWFFSVAYLFVFGKKRSILHVGLITINFLAIFISYTKSFMANAMIIALLYLFLTAYKKRDFGTMAKNIVLMCLGGVIFFLAVARFLPVNTNYFLSRIQELKQSPANDESNSLLFRFSMTGQVIENMGKDKQILGEGPVSEFQLRRVEDMRATTADMVWTGVIFRWGFVGLVLFILLFLIAIIKAFDLFMNSDGLLSQLALLFLLTIISQIIESFTSGTFMTESRFAMGLWYFGILSALIGFNRKTDFSFENELVSE